MEVWGGAGFSAWAMLATRWIVKIMGVDFTAAFRRERRGAEGRFDFKGGFLAQAAGEFMCMFR